MAERLGTEGKDLTCLSMIHLGMDPDGRDTTMQDSSSGFSRAIHVLHVSLAIQGCIFSVIGYVEVRVLEVTLETRQGYGLS